MKTSYFLDNQLTNIVLIEVAPVAAHAAAPKKKAVPASQAAVVAAPAAPAAPVKKEKRKKDPNAPKKPMSAFFCFQMARRQGLKGEAPGLNHKDIIKVSTPAITILMIENDRGMEGPD